MVLSVLVEPVWPGAAAPREELDREYEASNGPGTKTSAPARQAKYPARLGLDRYGGS